MGSERYWVVLQMVVFVVLVVVFHRLRDKRLLDGCAHEVFPLPLGAVYVVGALGVWVVQGYGLVVALSAGADQDAVQPSPALLLLLVLGWFVLTVVVWKRLDRADAELHGPVAGLGRFLRVATGSAARAALRSLRPAVDQ